ncbi:hypothetical protein LtaPh_3122900 [Leishmania tarentolae]|uniref:Uncharacterized protein n=1 Tax=Leishmania tarentolae TaxID=5689 RepID=A0A640KUH1_LEITA|nr:hypothetical protein LtaPh_3122900 [Leishmania tarentolae]
MEADNDSLIIILLWLVYVCLHACLDYCERRSLLRAQELEARVRAQAAVRRLDRRPRSSPRIASISENPTASITVIVLGTEGEQYPNRDEPCEGAVVPDASGQMPALPEQVHYGESTYMNRQEGSSDASVEKEMEESSPAAEVDAGRDDPALR